MGRTLHFSIKKEKSNFTKDELVKIYEVCKFYNSKELLDEINTTFNSKLKALWTCENFWIGLGSYYPDWKNPLFKKGADFAWNYIAKREKELMNTMSYYDTLAQLEKEGLIVDGIQKTNELRGFTKTQGNEFNSMLVLKALVAISKKLPKVEIELSDEGEFLLCDLKIKNGKALPMINELVESMQGYALKMLLSKGFEGNILKDLTATEFTHEFKMDIGIENPYGDMTSCINDRLRNLKEVEKVLIKEGLKGNQLYFYNLENSGKRFNPESFTRTVNVEKFLGYEMNVGTLMDGFHGEGFGLTDKDSESESYKRLAQMFSLLEKIGADKKDVKILGQK